MTLNREQLAGASKEALKAQAIRLIRSLVLFSQTLETLPHQRYLTMKLLYYDGKKAE